MLLGEVVGKTTPKEISVKLFQEAKTHDFIAVKSNNRWVLGYIQDIETQPDGEIIAYCYLIGYRDRGVLITPKTPVKPGTLVYRANNSLLNEVFNFNPDGVYVGVLENNNEVRVFLDVEHLISKHIAVLATTGSGKSYTVGVIIEELIEKNIPVVVIDPHGEYSSMRYENDSDDNSLFEFFGISPKGYNVVELSPDVSLNPQAKPLIFEDKNLTPQEIIQMLPTKPTPSQVGLIYSAIKDLKERKKEYTLEDIINEISNMESNAKWNIINMIDVIKNTGLFGKNPTNLKEVIKRGNLVVINLRGISIDIQQIVVQRISHQLFEYRKLGRIPPLFLVIEEAHNYIPEKEVTYSSKILRNIASEGRKFGLGLCVVTQRPARIDKNILSQCNTQIILRLTNPNDLKAISYAEHSFNDLEKEIKNLSVGNAVILGFEVPLFVKIRVRRSKHGGDTPSIVSTENAIKVLSPQRNIALPTDYKSKLYYPFYYLVLNDGSGYLIDAIRGKQLYFKENKPYEVNPLDLEKNVFVRFSLETENNAHEYLEPKIDVNKILEVLGGEVKSHEVVYYPYYVSDSYVIDGVLGRKIEKK